MVQRIGVRVEYKVHRLAEGNKKQKKNERRVTPYDGGGVDSVDGFVGLVDTGIDWCYD